MANGPPAYLRGAGVSWAFRLIGFNASLALQEGCVREDDTHGSVPSGRRCGHTDARAGRRMGHDRRIQHLGLSVLDDQLMAELVRCFEAKPTDRPAPTAGGSELRSTNRGRRVLPEERGPVEWFARPP